ncbi:MAG TPA: superoxide dismutase [Smithella sp.]|nr:superoxide dismutase [Smithella sp.]
MQEKSKFYKMPASSYGFKDLAPFLSEEQLMIHVEKHHRSYVNNGNAILEKLDKAHRGEADLDMKSTLKELSFNIGGHILHCLFWGNLLPAAKYEEPGGALNKMLIAEFGSMERFKKEFTQAAQSVEGSGWAALVFCHHTERLLLMQIEKHNVNVYPMHNILMILDVFEHAYYLDYKNDRAKYIEAFWKHVNWKEVAARLEKILK